MLSANSTFRICVARTMNRGCYENTRCMTARSMIWTWTCCLQWPVKRGFRRTCQCVYCVFADLNAIMQDTYVSNVTATSPMTGVAVNVLTIPVANIWVNYPFTQLNTVTAGMEVIVNRDDDGKQISTVQIDRQLVQKISFPSGYNYRGCFSARLGSMRHCFPYDNNTSQV